MAASTVVVAREDFSIPGSLEANGTNQSDPEHLENHFFNTLLQHKADAVVLDLTGSQGKGIAAILKIRQRSAVPIVVLCGPEDAMASQYRHAGAAACMSPPIDLLGLKQAIRQAGQQKLEPRDKAESLAFAGLVLEPRDRRLVAESGASVQLSAIEAGVLLYLAGTPGVIWPAKTIAEAVGGACRGDPERAVAGAVARLCKKIGSLAGPTARQLIKNETGDRYLFAAAGSPDTDALPLAATVARQAR